MKSRAQADSPASFREPLGQGPSGEFLTPHASGVRVVLPGDGPAPTESQRFERRIAELESLLEERTSELFLARETERLVQGSLPDAREAPPGVLIRLTRAGLIESINYAGLSLLGYEEAELVGQPFTRLLDGADARALEEAEALSPEGTALRTERTLVAKSGLRHRVAFSIGALGVVDSAGQPRSFVCTAFELGVRRNWELAVRQGERLEAVGRLTTGVVHEIDAPIQFVLEGVHFLREATEDLLALLEKHRAVLRSIRSGTLATDAAARAAAAEDETDLAYLLENMPKAFGACVDGLDRVAVIARSMKDFAAPDAREMVEVDLNQAIETTLTIAQNEYKYVAYLRTELGPLPPIRCHVGEVNQAVLNLVVNAAHAIADVVKGTDKKGRITVRTRLEGDDVIVSVSDTGGGIPEPIRNRIFEPFFTTKEAGKGVGQGLAVARSIVAGKHGGKLWFESVVGQGTTFFMRVPCGTTISAPTARANLR
jgi:two-component system, NtrC family, sensor kinase